MRHLALAAVFAAGCSTTDAASTGTASVQLYNRDGVALAHWPVMFHGADGSRLAVVNTTQSGLASGPMEPGGMVTYRSPFPNNQLVTRGGIQPDDRVFDGVRPERVDPAPRYAVVVSTPGAPSSARLCQIAIVCGDRTVEARGVPGADIAVEVPQTCLAADATGNRSAYALATATDETYQIIAYAVFPAVVLPTDGIARVAITEWRTDFTDSLATITGLDPDLVRYSVDAKAFVGSAAIARVIRDGDGPATTVSSTVHLPAGLPGASLYRFEALFATGELVVEQHVTAGAPLFLGPADLPPRITAMSLAPTPGDPDTGRPTITFTTERSIDDVVTIDAVLVAYDASWRLANMPGPSVHLPELHAELFPYLPLFTADDLALREVAATTRTPSSHGDTVRTTAMPYAPW
jgi:hypothetical protein